MTPDNRAAALADMQLAINCLALELPSAVYADVVARWSALKEALTEAQTGEDVVEKMAEALRGSQAAFSIMLDSAHSNTDLTDEGLANLFNATEAASTEALAAYEKGRGR